VEPRIADAVRFGILADRGWLVAGLGKLVEDRGPPIGTAIVKSS
jgi:hypothetical protein